VSNAHRDLASRFSPPAAKIYGRRSSWAGSAPNQEFVVWGALLNRRNKQQKIPVGKAAHSQQKWAVGTSGAAGGPTCLPCQPTCKTLLKTGREQPQPCSWNCCLRRAVRSPQHAVRTPSAVRSRSSGRLLPAGCVRRRGGGGRASGPPRGAATTTTGTPLATGAPLPLLGAGPTISAAMGKPRGAPGQPRFPAAGKDKITRRRWSAEEDAELARLTAAETCLTERGKVDFEKVAKQMEKYDRTAASLQQRWSGVKTKKWWAPKPGISKVARLLTQSACPACL
jgi:hypothetical protein